MRASLRSDPDTASSSKFRDTTAQAATRLLATVSSNVVFLQFQGQEHRQSMNRLRKYLAEAGFVAPGVEYIVKPFPSSVRYFHSEDSLKAVRAAKISEDFMRKEQLSADSLGLQNMSRRGFRVPRGQIEVWLSIK